MDSYILNPNGKNVLKDNLISGQEFVYPLDEYEIHYSYLFNKSVPR